MRITNLHRVALTLVIACSIACNQTDVKKDPQKTDDQSKTVKTPAQDTAVICDYYIDKTTAEGMIKDFLRRYKKKGTPQEVSGLETEIWVDSCVFTALRKFFATANQNYDGVRIFHVGKQKSGLLVVPTSLVNPPSIQNYHLNRFDTKINLPTNCGTTITINLEEYDSRELIDDFGEKFRRETRRSNRLSATNDSLSAGLWLEKCKIQHIARMLEDPSNNVNGMIVYEACYSKLQANNAQIGQKHDRQSTLILVPGKKTGSSCVPNWEVVTAPTQALVEQVKLGGYNHGSLCPNICN